MKKTRKRFSLILMLGLALVLLTGCAAKGFDGSWNCIEAEIPTYGMLSASDAALIERSGVVSTMCEIEIKGTDIKYTESGSNYAVSDVRRDDTVITFKAKHNISGTDTVTLKLSSDGKKITAKRYQSSFVLERSDFWNKVVIGFFNGIPTWVYIVLGVVVVLLILGKFFSLKKEGKLRDQGKIVYRDKEFYKNAEVFTLSPISPSQITEPLKALSAELKLALKGNTGKTVSFHGGPGTSWAADLTCRQADTEKTVYSFEFTSWKSTSRSGKPDDELAMNMVETAVEKMFLSLDPNTQVHTEPKSFHATDA